MEILVLSGGELCCGWLVEVGWLFQILVWDSLFDGGLVLVSLFDGGLVLVSLLGNLMRWVRVRVKVVV